MYIYKITHKTTHQSYIGQTKNPFERWAQHAHNKDLPIQLAIQEEGLQNFTFEILEQCDDNKADNQENYWIHYYHSVIEGYNTTVGTCIPDKDTFKNNIAPPKEDHRGESFGINGIDAYDAKTGTFVRHYDSIAEANRVLGHEGTGNISAVCRGKRKTAYGFIWRYSAPGPDQG